MNMDINFQIQGIKSQVDNMKFQIENIENQNNNMMNPMMQTNQIGDQILILSMQMFNTGIQTFNIGKTLSMNLNKYFDQLKKISEQLNNLIKQEEMNQQMMIQQEMMIQQQIMAQQQMNFQHQQMMEQNFREQKIKEWKIVNLLFRAQNGNLKTIVIETERTIKELIDKYMEVVYGFENRNIIFVFNANKLNRNDNRKIKEYFSSFKGLSILPIIMVLETR